MSTDTPTPNPSLLAILLVIKTRAGPRVLLHYPPSQTPKRPSGPAKATPPSTTPESQDRSDVETWPSDEDDSVRSLMRGLTRSAPSRRSKIGVDANGGASSDDNNNDSDVDNAEDIESNVASSYPTGDINPHASATTRPHQAFPNGPSPPLKSSPQNNISTSTTTSSTRTTARSWTLVLGFPSDSLAKMLAPTERTWHKTRFEVGLGGKCFVGCPVFEREEGGWDRPRRRKKRRGRSKLKRGHDDDEGTDGFGESGSEGDEGLGMGTGAKASAATSAEPIPVATTAAAAAGASPKAAAAGMSFASATTTSSSHPSSSSATSGVSPESLTMFNVVFVLALPGTQGGLQTPHPHLQEHKHYQRRSPGAEAMGAGYAGGGSLAEHQRRVREVYTHCAKKVARALQQRQRGVGYVWEEARKVIGVRDKAREAGQSYAATWPALSASSSLARALAAAYTGLSTSRLAHLSLGPTLSLSLQLPQLISTPHVPTPTSQSSGVTTTAGLWLTTFNPNPLQDDQLDDTTGPGATTTTATGTISPHSALLLLVPADTLLKEIAASPSSSLAAPLTYYIRHTLPTKTLLQLSRKSRLTLQDLQILSLHLIHWRRARAIPPLHLTHAYIVSPLADFELLPAATAAFSAHFSALPSLPAVLTKVSAMSAKGPQAWGALVPSSDHKIAYMEILEWLVKGGWVTQLRTFCWVIVSRDVKAAVARKMKAEEKEAATAAGAVEEEDYGEMDDTAIGGMGGGNASEVGKRRKSSQGSASLLSPRLKPHLFPGRRTSEAGSISSASTALRIPARSGMRLELSPGHGKLGHAHRLSDSSIRSRVNLDGTSEAAELGCDPRDFEPSIVISPHKASALESRWLEHIGSSFLDVETRELWPKLLKYFDGKHAMEEIALREGLKRKAVSPVLTRLMDIGGVLRTVRHW